MYVATDRSLLQHRHFPFFFFLCDLSNDYKIHLVTLLFFTDNCCKLTFTFYFVLSPIKFCLFKKKNKNKSYHHEKWQHFYPGLTYFKIQLINSLSARSDCLLMSHYSITIKCEDHQNNRFNKLLIVKFVLLVSIIGNVLRTIRRILHQCWSIN